VFFCWKGAQGWERKVKPEPSPGVRKKKKHVMLVVCGNWLEDVHPPTSESARVPVALKEPPTVVVVNLQTLGIQITFIPHTLVMVLFFLFSRASFLPPPSPLLPPPSLPLTSSPW
jgi:hypothetical protein